MEKDQKETGTVLSGNEAVNNSEQTTGKISIEGSEETSKKHRSAKKGKRVIPGFGLSMGIVLAMLSMIILIPLASVLGYAFRLKPAELTKILSDSTVQWAFLTSIWTAFIAAVINVIFGTILAWVLVRYEFPGKRIIDGLIEVPFTLPTAVAGITLSKMYSTTGEIGKPLSHLGLKISYTHLGLIVALVFIGIPFVVRAIQPVLEKFDSQYEEAAYMLGATSRTTFKRVILPELRPAMITGFGLAFARGIGEYGSVIYISGNSAKEHTQVVSYIIMQKLERLDYSGATAIALIMLIISFLLLLFINIVQVRQSRRTNNI